MRRVDRFLSAVRTALGLVVLLSGAAGIVLVRASGTLPGAAPSADALRTAAADSLEVALGAGGSGMAFEVAQTNTLHAIEGGPQIAVTAPDDQTKVVGLADEYQVSTIFSRGAVTPKAFWMEMRGSQAAEPDFSTADFFARVVDRGGELWRDDGIGWYLTDESPGVGMDPATARLLPDLLRSLDKAEVLEPMLLDGRMAPGIRGTSVPAAYPGVIAADGAAFTEESFEVDCWFDDQGRLIRLEARARNLNQRTYDLIATTVVTLSYGPPGDPPETSPTKAPEVPPTNDPDSAEVPA